MLPINEFDFDGICALLFPTLFPFGMGDPTKKSRLKEVTEALGFKHLLKYACKNSKQELYYPFAEHQRFKFWAHDRRRRHTSLGQARVFFKQNPTEANLSIKELKSKVNTGTWYNTFLSVLTNTNKIIFLLDESGDLLKTMSAYSANVPGSDPYWFQRTGERESTFEQEGLNKLN